MRLLITYILIHFIFFNLQSQSSKQFFHEGFIYVKFKEPEASLMREWQKDEGLEALTPRLKLHELASEYRFTAIEKRFKTPSLQSICKIFFEDTQKVEQLIREFEKLPFVQYACKAPVYRSCFTPNDVHQNQWYMNLIEAFDAWDITTGNPHVKVAIVDDAVKISHPDLAPIIWNNPLEVPDSIDNDGNGFIDDIHGWDVANNDNDPEPPLSHWMYQFSDMIFTHGTHCAGIAGAATNNNTGIASIGYGISIIPVKCTADNSILPLAIDDGPGGIDYAIAAGADVISLSWGSAQNDSVVRSAVNAALAQGIIVVAAAGNDGSQSLFYPASLDGVISVGAITKNDIIASFSQRNEKVTLMAPGDSIWSCQRKNNGYMYLEGTSMACPMVAGLAGLLKSYDTTLTATTIKSCLVAGCDNIDAINPSNAGLMGAGRINAHRSLQCIQNNQNIKENTRKNDIFIFPNPASDIVNILSENLEKYTELQILDILGKVHQLIKLNENRINMEINIQYLTDGIYFIALNNKENRIIGGKFIKRKF